VTQSQSLVRDECVNRQWTQFWTSSSLAQHYMNHSIQLVTVVGSKDRTIELGQQKNNLCLLFQVT